MASAVYERIFDDVFTMTSAENPIRSSVFGLYFGENTSVGTLWGLSAGGGEKGCASVHERKELLLQGPV